VRSGLSTCFLPASGVGVVSVADQLGVGVIFARQRSFPCRSSSAESVKSQEAKRPSDLELLVVMAFLLEPTGGFEPST
jgi:hypothetical protein